MVPYLVSNATVSGEGAGVGTLPALAWLYPCRRGGWRFDNTEFWKELCESIGMQKGAKENKWEGEASACQIKTFYGQGRD